MNYELIIEDLKKLSLQEQLYLEISRGVPSPSFEEMKAKYPQYPDDLMLAFYPEQFKKSFSEDYFIQDNQNVAIVKHSRFMPVFYHRHSFFEMAYILCGQCTQYLNGSALHLQTGDLCLIAPDTTHAIGTVSEDTILLNLLIRKSTFMDIFFHAVRDKSQLSLFFLDHIFAGKKANFLVFHTAHDEYILNAILDMYLEQLHHDEFSDRILCGMMMIFFTQLTRRHRKKMDSSMVSSPEQSYVISVIDYITMNYATVTLENLSSHFHFSVPYMSKQIKKCFGVGFHDLLTSIRMQHAQNYLLSTHFTVAQISDTLGYANPETFIRCFNRCFHMTPTQFRADSSKAVQQGRTV